LPLNGEVSVQGGDSSPQVSTETSENQYSRRARPVPVFDQDYVSMLSHFLSEDAIGSNGISLVVNGVEANGPGVLPSAVQEVKINQNLFRTVFPSGKRVWKSSPNLALQHFTAQ
jgi:hypothetical protein